MEGPDIPHQCRCGTRSVLLFPLFISSVDFTRSQSLLLQGCIVKKRFSADFPSKQSIYFGDNPLSVLSSNTSKIIPDFLPAQPNSAIIFTLVPYLETMTYETWISQIFFGSLLYLCSTSPNPDLSSYLYFWSPALGLLSETGLPAIFWNKVRNMCVVHTNLLKI